MQVVRPGMHARDRIEESRLPIKGVFFIAADTLSIAFRTGAACRSRTFVVLLFIPRRF